MEKTLFEVLQKFFLKGKLILLLIGILSFVVYPIFEIKFINFKDIDVLALRVNQQTNERAYNLIKNAPLKYVHILAKITDRDKIDRSEELHRLDCRSFDGHRKFDVDCEFFKRLNKKNRKEEIEKTINFIKEDYKKYQVSYIIPQINILKEENKALDSLTMSQVSIKRKEEMMLSNKSKIIMLKNLIEIIKKNDVESITIEHKIIHKDKNTLLNSILVFIMLCFINFCRVILID